MTADKSSGAPYVLAALLAVALIVESFALYHQSNPAPSRYVVTCATRTDTVLATRADFYPDDVHLYDGDALTLRVPESCSVKRVRWAMRLASIEG